MVAVLRVALGAPTPAAGGKEAACRLVVQAADPKLLEIVAAMRQPSRFPRRLHRRQQKRNQNGDDRDDDQELNQGERGCCTADGILV